MADADRDRRRRQDETTQAERAATAVAPAPTAEHASAMGNQAFGETLASMAGGASLARKPLDPATATPAGPSLARRVLARRGAPIPAGAIPIPAPTNTVDGTRVVTKLNEVGTAIFPTRGTFDGFNGTPVERQIINAFETSNLQPRSIAINWTDERGLNKIWTGTVNIRQENPTPLGAAGTGKITGSGGGSGTSGTNTSTSTTTGGSAEGGAGGHEGGASGKAGGSTSTTTSQGEAQGATGSGGTGSETQDRLQRYQCTIVADIFLRCEFDVSGSDYLNPFKWGNYLGEAMQGPFQRSDSVDCGTWTYQVSTGFAPGAPAGG